MNSDCELCSLDAEALAGVSGGGVFRTYREQREMGASRLKAFGMAVADFPWRGLPSKLINNAMPSYYDEIGAKPIPPLS